MSTNKPMAGEQLHPSVGWQGWLYWLRHWRCPVARQRLRGQVGNFVRQWAPWLIFWKPAPAPPPPPAAAQALPAWAAGLLGAGDPILAGSERILDRLEELQPSLAGQNPPVIAYQAGLEQMAAAACHPVETIWLLEARGYTVYLVGACGLQKRAPGWHTPLLPGAPVPWLLAVPAKRAAGLAAFMEDRQ